MPKITAPIEQFKGDFEFLSNFYPSPLLYSLERYPTAEHAYQGAKCEHDKDRERIKDCETPGQARKLGRKVKLIANWEKVKIQVMRDVLKCKFLQNPELAIKLIKTGERKLIGGNWWKDTFWGVSNFGYNKGQGENHLGKLLMELRSDLRQAVERSLICRK